MLQVACLGRGGKATGTAAATAGATALAAELKQFNKAAAGAVPFVGGIAGWALGEALEQLVLYLGDVQQYPARCRELIKLLGDSNGLVRVVLAALDEFTDRHDEEAEAMRGTYDGLCELLQRAQLLLADARAYVRALPVEPAPEPKAPQPTSLQRVRAVAACASMRQRWGERTPRWLDAPAVKDVCSELAAQCSFERCLALTTAMEQLRARLECDQHQATCRVQFLPQPEVVFPPKPGRDAPLAPVPPGQPHVQLDDTLGSPVREVKSLLAANATVAIVGGGGTGKTTLARAVYNQLKDQFQACHFMTVGRDVNFQQLLQKAWEDMYGSAPIFQDARDGCDQLIAQPSSRKVLLVLDDLWLHDSDHKRVNMLRSLNFATPPNMGRANESRLIVTTRDERAMSYQPHVAQAPLFGKKYSMPLLDDASATKLFLSRAGVDGDIAAMSAAQRELVQQFVTKGAGNPKALELLGGSVQRLSSFIEWGSVLSTYSDPTNGADLSRICSTSYDALRPSLQQCVRDLSFFPEDAELQEAELVHLFATHAPVGGASATAAARGKLRELVQCSLVDVNVVKTKMKYSLLDRALDKLRELVQCSLVDVVETKMKYSVHDTVHDLSKALAKASEAGRAVSQLVQQGGGAIAVQLSPSKLAVREKLKAGPQDEAGGHAARVAQPDLRAVRYVSVHRTGCPDTSRLKLLQFLQLVECNMSSMPDSISECGQLAHLELRQCKALTALPDGIGSCSKLTDLDLSGCEALTALPDGIGSCSKLTDLDLSGCKALTALPDGIGSCSKLTDLDLSWCKALTALPEGIGGCSQLAHLDLSWCKTLTALPEGIGGCSQLARLDLRSCWALKELPKGIGSCSQLTHLDVSRCKALTELPDGIGGCSQLAHLDLRWCAALKALPEGIGGCSQLAHLDLSGCEALTALPENISGCSKLADLDLSGCKALTAALPHRFRECSRFASERFDLRDCVPLQTPSADILALQPLL